MKALQPGPQHRSVGLVEQSLGDVHHPLGVNAHEVAVIGEVMDRAQRDPVDDRGVPTRVPVLDDVRRLQQRRFRRLHTAHRLEYARSTAEWERF